MGSSTGIARDTQPQTDEDDHPDEEWWFPFTQEDNFS